MMQALEFTSTIQEGMIKLPERYNQYDNQQVRIIVLIDTLNQTNSQKEQLSDVFQRMKTQKMFSKINNPVTWQKQMRDEWE